ncbi:MAG: flagellar motor switch protein FliG [Thermodesulfobacteriota bacterium]|nr:flagellar motor switch protein FliG [Thermodesulfobacteriota bacterium]
MDSMNLDGSLKVAILLHSLGGDACNEVLQSLDQSERQIIQGHLSQMGAIPQDLVDAVTQEFAGIVSQGTARNTPPLPRPTGEKTEQRATPSESKGLKALQSLGPDQLSSLIKDEHPQTIAIILAHLSTSVAGKVLNAFADELKADVAIRIANLDEVMPGMVEEIDHVLETMLSEKQVSSGQKLGGVNQLAEILNQTTSGSAQLVLDEVAKVNPELVGEIKQKMLVFEDVRLIDDAGLQKVLRNVETKELAVALKVASEEVKEKIFKNMSSRAAEMLREEVEEMGPVRIKEVEDAQRNITTIIQDMEEKGELTISGRGGDEFIE